MATATDSDTSNAGDECSICLVPLSQQGLDIFTTACHHQFHFQCLAKNVQAQNSECPLCRTHLDSLVNILKATSNSIIPVPTETVPVQQVAPIQTIPTQQAAPLPMQQGAPLPTASTVDDAGVWNALTKSLRNAFSWIGSGSKTASSSIDPKKQQSKWSVSS
jgi:hypothetical protein